MKLIVFVTTWYLPGICLIPIWYLPSICLTPTWYLSGTCLIPTWYLPDTDLVPAWYLPGICLKTIWYRPDTRLIHSQYLLCICVIFIVNWCHLNKSESNQYCVNEHWKHFKYSVLIFMDKLIWQHKSTNKSENCFMDKCYYLLCVGECFVLLAGWTLRSRPPTSVSVRCSTVWYFAPEEQPDKHWTNCWSYNLRRPVIMNRHQAGQHTQLSFTNLL